MPGSNKSIFLDEVLFLVGILRATIVGKDKLVGVDCTCCSSDESSAYCTYCSEIFQEPRQQECPICFMPFSFGGFKGVYLPCCGKAICSCCLYQQDISAFEKEVGAAGGYNVMLGPRSTCPFCRAQIHRCQSADETEKKNLQLQKRIDMDDGNACSVLADDHIRQVFPEDRSSAEDLIRAGQLFIQAAELGHVDESGIANLLGQIAEEFEAAGIRDNDFFRVSVKEILVTGAKNGCLDCHHYLGHGSTPSSKMLLDGFVAGHITKDEYAEALRAYKVAYDATMSQERHFWTSLCKRDNFAIKGLKAKLDPTPRCV
ncbi:hypothetical protein ACHAWF_006041 [Thalassiosira exigua]